MGQFATATTSSASIPPLQLARLHVHVTSAAIWLSTELATGTVVPLLSPRRRSALVDGPRHMDGLVTTSAKTRSTMLRKQAKKAVPSLVSVVARNVVPSLVSAVPRQLSAPTRSVLARSSAPTSTKRPWKDRASPGHE